MDIQYKNYLFSCRKKIIIVSYFSFLSVVLFFLLFLHRTILNLSDKFFFLELGGERDFSETFCRIARFNTDLFCVSSFSFIHFFSPLPLLFSVFNLLFRFCFLPLLLLILYQLFKKNCYKNRKISFRKTFFFFFAFCY